MRYLEAKRLVVQKGEHKMAPGIRVDQRDETVPVNAGTDKMSPEHLGEVKIRPDVYELADELNVDLSTVKGTGRDGQITKSDVRQAAKLKSEG